MLGSHADEASSREVEHQILALRELLLGSVEVEDRLDRRKMRGVKGRSGSRDEKATVKRKTRAMRKGEESNVGVDGLLPGRSKHLDRRDRAELPEFLVGFVGIDGVVAREEL